MTIKKIVLTGGPCSGKSTVLRALKAEFGEQVVLVPEVATILLQGGYPMPGRDIEWSLEWQAGFQATVLSMQLKFEESFKAVARQKGARVMVCDRGILDGGAYTPGGLDEFCRRQGLDKAESFGRYEAVIHLESLATCKPELYGKTDNEVRFESLEEAQKVEIDTRQAWNQHKDWQIIGGQAGVEDKIEQVVLIVKKHL